jgi:hypothetical protein
LFSKQAGLPVARTAQGINFYPFQLSLNAELPPAPEPPKAKDAPKMEPEPKEEAMEEEDPESDLELDMTGVIGRRNSLHCFIPNGKRLHNKFGWWFQKHSATIWGRCYNCT